MEKIEALIEDTNLRLLLDDNTGDNCAVQIWLLQTIQNGFKKSTLLYARILPSSHQNNEWSAPKEDHFKTIKNIKAQLLPLSLYCTPSKAKELINNLTSGKSLPDISKELDIKISDSIEKRTEDFSITQELIFKPTTLLPMRNAPREGNIRSPHGTASAFSASIIITNRGKIFDIDNIFSAEIATFAITQINKETGMLFNLEDSTRLGTIELLLFPTLNNKEQDNLHTSWDREKNRFQVELNLNTRISNPKTTSASLHIHFINNNQTIHSTAINQNPTEGILRFSIDVPENKTEIIDSLKFEIFTFSDESSSGRLYCSYNVSYIRANTISTRIGTISGKSIKFSWLTDVINISPKLDRIKSLQTINHGSKASYSKFKLDMGDPWVSSNHQMKSLVKEAFPEKSEAGFFQRFRDSGGIGRIELVEWIHKVLASYQEHQIVIFDPYFEDIGISLLLPKASTGSEYIVITTWEPSQPSQRIANAIQTYQQIASLTDNIDFKLYGVPKDFLHDRYIIISDKSGKPIKGYHLSNSLQNATDSHPLLITPIPNDTLPKVEEYTHQLLSKSKTLGNSLDLLIDSKDHSKQTQPISAYEPLSFLDSPVAPIAISSWVNIPLLTTLNPADLKLKLEELGYTENNTLNSKKLGPPYLFP